MKLDQANVEDILALTPLQEGILYHHLSQPDAGLYLEQLSLELSGRVDPERFAGAWRRVCAANPMLRTIFRWENLSHPVQIVLRRNQPMILIRRLGSGDAQTFVDSARRRDREEPFDLRQSPFRITLLILGQDRSWMLVSSHHILFDGWSNGIILREFMAAYHDPDWRPPAKPEFKAFVKFLRQRDAKLDLAFWRGYLHDHERRPLPRLSAPGPAPAGRLDLVLPRELSQEMAACARRLRLTQASLIHAAWGLLMQRYLDARDVVIGSTVAGRDLSIPGGEHTVGLFINSLPLRVRTSPHTTGTDLARAVAEDLIAMQEHQHASLLEIRGAIGVKAGGEMFDSLVAVENYPLEVAALRGSELAVVGHDFSEQTHYPLSLGFLPHQPERCVITHREGILSPSAAHRLGEHFIAILNGLVRRPEALVDAIEMLGETERRKLLEDFNPAPTVWDGPELIQTQFEDRAARWPQRLALVWDGGGMSYAELNQRANLLAWRLKALGLGPDQVAALCLPRSAEMVIAVLAVLKAGGAYLPLDPEAPPHRLRLVLDDARPRCLIAIGPLADQALEIDPNLPVLDLARETGDPDMVGNPPLVNQPSDLAYCIYTSGSTGRPKGVLVEHRAAVNLLRVMESNWPVGDEDAWLLKTNYTFDVSLTELCGWFFGRGRLALLPPGGEKDPAVILDAVRRHGVTHLNFAPSMLRAFQEHLEQTGASGLAGLKYLCAAGENLSGDLARRFLALGLPARLLDLYGPTEATVYATGGDAADEPPDAPWIGIGRPLPTYRAYVLGLHGGPQPLGVTGELCLGGVGLARGYLNRPEITSEKFVADPFLPGQRIYRTGDLAFWRADGRLVCLGRLDHQVKLQGHRIELGEVEVVLARHPSLAEAAVVVRGEARGGEGLLCAYISLRDEVGPEALAPGELRRFLAQSLPPYMIPAHFLVMDRLPRGSSGKLDRRALPSPEAISPPETLPMDEASSAVEARIAAIWREVLGLETVGLNQNFFDLGGHSIALVRVNTRLNRTFGLALTVTELFAHSTIRQQARLVEAAQSPVKAPDDLARQPRVGDSAPSTSQASAGPDWTPIAVIGLDGRFPGAADVDHLWRNLLAGVESIRFFTPEELRAAGVDEKLITDPDYVPAKGWLEDSDRFDAEVFGYSDGEAAAMDPQLRLLHQCALHVLERAGYDPWRYPGAIGLYAGASPNPGWLAGLGPGISPSELYAAMTLNERDFLCARVSHRLGLRGPALTVQTACSTSLVAVHLACRALMQGDCDLALAGGVSLVGPPQSGYLHQPGMIRTPDGHCRPFDAAANGTLGGDGVGLVALKRLDRALAEGDQVLAVIKGGAINNDGGDKLGYTAPSIAGQAEVISRALERAGIDPDSIGYLEAHGTGTPLGDPVEVAALKIAFATHRRGYCALGSLKANLGHLDAAAGVAGLIKVVMLLRHGVIPPSVNFTIPNPALMLEQSPFRVTTVAEPWPERLLPRRAGVSSFGIGGTNAHLVLEQAPAPLPDSPAEDGPRLLRLSARSPEALTELASRLATHLERHPDTNLDHLAFTLGQGRRAWEHRLSLVCRATDQARTRLTAAPSLTSRSREDMSAVLVFPGQGAQHVDMGRGLYQAWPAFRRELDHCLDRLESLAGEPLRPLLYPADATARREAAARIDQTSLAQPLLFALEYALGRALLGLGIRPRALIGHSLGEYVAACLAGVMSLEDALGVVLWRGRAMQALPAGGMCALSLSRSEAEDLLSRFGSADLGLAAINSPTACVVSGPIPDIESFERFAATQGAPARRLRTSHAFHSAMMEPVLKPLADLLAGIKLRPPTAPYLSNLSGGFISPEQAQSPEYWTEHLRRPVNFSDGVATIIAGGPTVFIELGPGGGLGGRVREQPGFGSDQAVVGLLRHPREEVPDLDRLLEGLGQIWRLGLDPAGDLPGLNPTGRRIALPVYPFAGRRYPSSTGSPVRGAMSAGPVGKRGRIADWLYTPLWRETPAPAARPTGAEPGHCLLLADDQGLAETLARRLERHGQRVALARRGDGFRSLGGGRYQASAQPADLAALWGALTQEGVRITRLVDLWPLAHSASADNPDLAPLGPDFRESLVVLQSLVASEAASGLRLYLVSRGMCRVGGESSPRPELAVLRGLGLGVSQEHPGLICRLIDLDPRPVRGWRAEAVVEDLAAEVLCDEAEPLVAWRGGRRWVEDFAPLPAPAIPAEPGPLAITTGGVYLLIGGLGTIGLTLAGHLASTPGVRLALCGRTPLPPRQAWTAWLDGRPAQDPIARRIIGLRQLEALGTEARIYTVNAGDQDELLALARQVEQDLGPIQGIVHAAGESFAHFFRPLAQIDTAYLDNEIIPRLKQARALVGLARTCRPTWCLVTSSLATVLGGRGLAGYASANHYLEALVAAQENSDTAWLTLAWDGWRPAYPDQAPDSAIAHLLITSEEGREALAQAMAHGRPGKVVISSGDLILRRREWVTQALDATPPDQSTVPAGQKDSAATTTAEDPAQAVARIWREVLGLASLETGSNFFTLGGDSLKAITLLGRIKADLGRELPLPEFLARPTLEANLALLAPAEREGLPPITPGPPARTYPLSSAQERLYVLQQMEPNDTSHHEAFSLLLEGPLDPERLRVAAQRLTERQPSLRTGILAGPDGPRQRVHDRVEIDWRYHDHSNPEPAPGFDQPFDLARPPLLRLELTLLAEGRHRLRVVIHHIITDGVSHAIFLRELLALYADQPLPPLPLQYGDYAIWQRQARDQGWLREQADFWRQRFATPPQPLELPTDFPRPSLHGFHGSSHRFAFDPELTAALRQIQAAAGATTYTTLLALFAVLLSQYSGQQDLVIGAPVSGRTQPGLEAIIGMFVNLVALRCRPEADLSFRQFLADLSQEAFAAFAHQDYPFEDLVSQLGLQGGLDRNPLFSVLCVLQNLGDTSVAAGGVVCRLEQAVEVRTHFDLTLIAVESSLSLDLTLVYSPLLFRSETVADMVRRLVAVAHQAAMEPDRPLAKLGLAGEIVCQISQMPDDEGDFGF